LVLGSFLAATVQLRKELCVMQVPGEGFGFLDELRGSCTVAGAGRRDEGRAGAGWFSRSGESWDLLSACFGARGLGCLFVKSGVALSFQASPPRRWRGMDEGRGRVATCPSLAAWAG
jgi:hypothetical protein